MKKFLSLVLALVMTMSLVTVSAGAKDFTDNGDITYDEAVAVMSAVGVIDGYEDGSFQPTTNLTRGAAAKIICNLILGPTTASALGADTAPYSDVPVTNTFAGYIAYCQKEGIISGYADGTFRPSDPLTGYAFMKMLLGALGYDSTKESYTGANWSVNVAKQALAIGLDDGNDEFSGQAYVNREEAMLYAFNTMQATMVTYGNDTTIVVGDVSFSTSGQAAYETCTMGSGNDGNIEEDGYVQFAERYFGNLKLTGGTDDFGRPANTWKVKSETVGTYAKEADASYTEKVKGGTIYSDLNKGAIDDDDVTYYVDGVEQTELPEDFSIAKSNDEKVGGQGSLTQVFFDADGDDDTDDVVITVINTYLAQVSGDYDEDDEELDIVLADDSATPEDGSSSWTLSIDDIANLDQFEDEDYVLITVASDNGDEDGQYVYSVDLAEKVTATVTSYTAGSSVTADGTKYSYNATCNEGDGVTEYVIKEDYDLYLDFYGNVIFAEGVDVEGNYLYVIDSAKAGSLSSSRVEAAVYFLDGTYAEITLNKVDDEKVSKAITEGWYTYTAKSDDTYNLTTVDDVENLAVEDDEDLFDGIYVGGIRATASTQFVIVGEEGENGDAYTGVKNAPSVKASTDGQDKTMGVAVMDGSYAKYVYIFVGDGKTTGSATSSDIIYILDTDWDKSVDEDENIYYTYTALVNGVEKDVNVSEDCDYASSLKTGLYSDVAYDSDGYVTDLEPVKADETNFIDCEEFTVEYYTEYDALTQSGSVVTFGEDGYYLADSAKIIVIDGDEAKTVTAKKLVSDYKGNNVKVYGVLDDGEFTALYVVLDDETAGGMKDDIDAVNAAKAAIEALNLEETQLESTVTTAEAAKTAVETAIEAAEIGDVVAEVTVADDESFVAPTSGEAGSCVATITLTQGEASAQVVVELDITAQD